ncbi:CPBP family intramembrane glutamic endopeptidase [Metabacillus malikii]|uniref:Membrane protease YdiL (CAAX protease family) n=1 Tax=Metabacillus malikii TaxID=1504265 RepID=A0ABT9ZJE4_9BACI|nr:type II CAAX endopeptidase family protein [Metabacillus malikii]MDQ0231350.1 membrane protease YdiL (CAAX protease family) [Metabacillus malikii]
MSNSFTNIQRGKNTHWRYFSSLLVILAFMIILGGLAYIIVGFAVGILNPELLDLELLETKGTILSDPLAEFYLVHITYIVTILGVWLAVKTILKRNLTSLITPNDKVSWSRIFYGFFISLAIFALFALLDFAIFPDSYALNDFDATRFLWLVMASLVLVPIQTTSEELLFRGFLLQWAGKLTRNPLFLTLIVGGIFGGLHFFNPEMQHGAFWVAIDYLAMGFIWTYITVKTNSSEYSIGAHAANNMFLCIFLTMEDTVVGDIPSLFVMTEVNAMLSAMTTVITGLIFLFFVLRKQRKESNV